MKFEFNDVVMAIDKGKLYEAKVLKSQNIGTTWKYFIHFQGWAKKFDVWIDENLIALKSDPKRIAKLTESVVGGGKSTKDKKTAKAKESVDLIKAESSSKEETESANASILRSNKRKSEAAEAALNENAATKKQKKQLLLADLVENEDEEYYKKVVIPLNLKKHLADEWGLITKDPKRLVKLPRAITVEMLIRDFLAERVAKLEKNVEEVCPN